MDLADIEAKVFRLGQWRNFEDLEASLNLSELNAIYEAMADEEERRNKFMAALEGIDLDEGKETAQDKFDAVQRRVQAKLSGRSSTDIEYDSLELDYEVER